jgi:hypothetical protein
LILLATCRRFCHADGAVIVFITEPINKELGGSFTAAAYPLTETGSVIKTTNPNLNK